MSVWKFAVNDPRSGWILLYSIMIRTNYQNVLSVFSCKQLKANQSLMSAGHQCRECTLLRFSWLNDVTSHWHKNHRSQCWINKYDGSRYKLNKIGPSIEPCGTPYDMTSGEGIKLSHSVGTNWSYFKIHKNNGISSYTVQTSHYK